MEGTRSNEKDINSPPDVLSIFNKQSLPELIDKTSRIFICGLAFDYSVIDTAINASKIGYSTYIVIDASRPVWDNEYKTDSAKLIEIMKKYKLHNTKVSLHAGPVEITSIGSDKSAVITGSTVKIVEAVNSYGLSQKAIATDLFASVLSLYVDQYHLIHAGIVDIDDLKEKLEIYQIEIK